MHLKLRLSPEATKPKGHHYVQASVALYLLSTLKMVTVLAPFTEIVGHAMNSVHTSIESLLRVAVNTLVHRHLKTSCSQSTGGPTCCLNCLDVPTLRDEYAL